MVASSSLLRFTLSAVAAAAVAAAAPQACGADGSSCPSASSMPAVSKDSVLLQLKSNRSVIKAHRLAEGSEEEALSFPSSGRKKAQGRWCEVAIPPDSWNLKSCPGGSGTRVKVLTYNLFWWNLFGKHKGSDRSAGKLIAQTAGGEGYDLMGFQECDSRYRVLGDARAEGLQGEWATVDGGHALALMYRSDRFQLLGQGSENVGEDSHEQWYGKRSAVWVRLRHSDGTTVFYINHHGPLPVSASGGCAGSSTALNIMRVIADHSHSGDRIILTGDFNAQPWSSRISELKKRMHLVYSGHSMGGVDHIFSNCNQNAQGHNLGKGVGRHGSDHDALSVTFQF